MTPRLQYFSKEFGYTKMDGVISGVTITDLGHCIWATDRLAEDLSVLTGH